MVKTSVRIYGNSPRMAVIGPATADEFPADNNTPLRMNRNLANCHDRCRLTGLQRASSIVVAHCIARLHRPQLNSMIVN